MLFRYKIRNYIQLTFKNVVDEKQNGVIDGVSEVKIDASAAKKRGSLTTSLATSAYRGDTFGFIIFILLFIHM